MEADRELSGRHQVERPAWRRVRTAPAGCSPGVGPVTIQVPLPVLGWTVSESWLLLATGLQVLEAMIAGIVGARAAGPAAAAPRESAWYRRGSPPFDATGRRDEQTRLRAGVEQDRVPTCGRPDDGYWSGAVNGLLIQWFAWWRDKHPAWRTGGETLRGFLRARRGELLDAGGVTIVAHSHGGQALAYALVDMHTAICPLYVVTVDMPVRRHMDVSRRFVALSTSTFLSRRASASKCSSRWGSLDAHRLVPACSATWRTGLEAGTSSADRRRWSSGWPGSTTTGGVWAETTVHSKSPTLRNEHHRERAASSTTRRRRGGQDIAAC